MALVQEPKCPKRNLFCWRPCPTDSLPAEIGYLEIVSMFEEEIMQLPHELMTPFEFENEWNADSKGLFDSTSQFIRAF